MSSDLTISAQVRSDAGKGASRRLRHADRVPGIVYGAGKEPVMISLLHKDLVHETENEAFFSSILDLDVDGNHEKVVVQDMQRHPAKKRLMHIDFLRVDATTKLTMNVPLHFINEEDCVGVKEDGGTIIHVATELEIQCLPADLPEYIEVDVLNLKLGDSIMMSELVMPEGVESVVLSHGEDHDQPIAAVQMMRGAEEDTDEAEDAGDVPASEQDGEGGDDDKADDDK